MQRQPLAARHRDRIAAGLPFVESLARRVAASMPHSIELGDLVQDGMIGLIDAACRFDEGRGIKFETFAERRVRGAMIDALRRDAWPRGVRRQRRELEAAREELRRELGAEPSLADLAARVGSDEARLGRTIVRINTIESTSPLSAGEHVDGASLPAALVPSEPLSPAKAYRRSGSARSDARRHRDASAARAQGHRLVLLRRGHDEADWRRDWRQRITRVAAARPRRAAAPESARRRQPGRAEQPRDPVLPAHDAQTADGEGRAPPRVLRAGRSWTCRSSPASCCSTGPRRRSRRSALRAGAPRSDGSRLSPRRDSALVLGLRSSVFGLWSLVCLVFGLSLSTRD